MSKCFVSYVDTSGIRRAVEVEAESMYEPSGKPAAGEAYIDIHAIPRGWIKSISKLMITFLEQSDIDDILENFGPRLSKASEGSHT